MIRSFASKETALIFAGKRSRRLPPDIQGRALIKLQILHAAPRLEVMGTLAGNHLEVLRGKRTGQHSIRINDQWRICFVWNEAGAEQVEIIDYHE